MESSYSANGTRLPPRQVSGLVTADTFNALRDYVANATTYISLVKHPLDIVHGGSQAGSGQDASLRTFFAEITSQTDAGPSQWAYGFHEVRKATGAGYATPWQQRSDGATGTAYNLTEVINGGAYFGNGIDVENLQLSFPYFAVMPCPIGGIVVVYTILVDNDELEYWFQYENAVDGEC